MGLVRSVDLPIVPEFFNLAGAERGGAWIAVSCFPTRKFLKTA